MKNIIYQSIIAGLFMMLIILVPSYKAHAAVTVTVSASPSAVSYGNDTTITWSSSGAISCTNNFNSSTATSGSYTYSSVTASKTFTVNCSSAELSATKCYQGFWQDPDPVHPNGGTVKYTGLDGVLYTESGIWMDAIVPITYKGGTTPSAQGCHSVACIGGTPAPVKETGSGSVTINFLVPLQMYVYDGGGTVSPSGINYYTAGTVVSISATPSSGYYFGGWGGSSDCLDNSITMPASGNRSCTAYFYANPTGTWSYPQACPTACGTPASTQTQTCTGGNGICSGTAASRSCSATSACPTGTWSYPQACPTACGTPASTQTQTCTGGNGICSGTAASRSCSVTSACAASDSCGPLSGATPQLSEPTGSNACTKGTLNSSSPLNTTAEWKWSCGTVTSCSAPKYGCNVSTDSNYNSTGPNNNWNCAGTCSNGATNYSSCTTFSTCSNSATNYPTCTINGGGSCINGAMNPPSCTLYTSGTISSSDCFIGDGSSSCITNLSWSTSNPVGTSAVTTPANITVKSANTSTSTYNVSRGSRTFYLYNNGILLGSTIATADCTSGTSWDSSSGTCKIIPVSVMSGSISTYDCIIPVGSSGCSASFSWNTTNPVSVSAVTTPVGNVAGNGNSGSSSYYFSRGSKTFYLYNNGILLDQGTSTADCGSTASWDSSSGTCKTNNVCSNGATNYPTCTINGSGSCINGATNPTACTVNGSGSCINTAGNPPTCNIFGIITNGGWTEWSTRSNQCPYSGTQTRSCTNPSPANGGADCSLLDGGNSSRAYTNDKCPSLSMSVTKNGLVIPLDKKIAYNTKVRIGWSSENVDSNSCSCSYVDNKGVGGSCGNGTSGFYVTPYLKRDTNYTISCNSYYGDSISASAKILVDKINAGYIQF